MRFLKLLSTRACTTLLVISASALSAVVSADNWWYVTSNSSGTDFYLSPVVDRNTTSPNLVRAWSVWNRVNAEPTDEGSNKILHEYDCQLRRWRTIRYVSYRGQMASGLVLTDHQPDREEWHTIEKGTTAEGLFTNVCAH